MNRAIKAVTLSTKICQLFESAGYSCIRGAGSKGEFLDEKVDLVCSRETKQNAFTVRLIVVGVQCKTRRKS